MIVIPEYEIRQIIDIAIAAIKDGSWYKDANGDSIFFSVPTTTLAKVKEYLANNATAGMQLHSRLSFPRNVATVPCIAIELANDTFGGRSGAKFIGDTGIADATVITTYTAPPNITLKLDMAYPPATVTMPHTRVVVGSLDIFVQRGASFFDLEEGVDYTVNYQTGVVTFTAGATQEHDNCYCREYSYKEGGLNTVTAVYNMTLMVGVFATNEDFVVLVYHYLKAHLLRYVADLHLQGILNLEMNGEGIQFDQSNLPADLFYRTINLSFEVNPVIPTSAPSDPSTLTGVLIADDVQVSPPEEEEE